MISGEMPGARSIWISTCGGGIVGYLFYFDLALFIGLEDRIDQLGRGYAVGNVLDQQRFFVGFFDMCANAYFAAPLPVVIVGGVDHPRRQEIGEELEFLTLEVFHCGFAKLAEIVREDLGGQTDGDAFGALGKQQREFHWQGNRFVLPSVIAELPFGGLGVETRLPVRIC